MSPTRLGLWSVPALWAALLIGGILATTNALTAQSLEGVVRAADSGDGLDGATVRQELAGGSFRAVRSEQTGEFQLELDGDPPYQIRVQRLGFGEWAETLESVPDSPLEVALERRPVELDEISAEVEREPIRIELPPTMRAYITDEGLYSTSIRKKHYNCNVLAIDSVVIRNPYYLEFVWTSLLRTSDLKRPPPYFSTDHWDNSTIPNPRIRRESYPCALSWKSARNVFNRVILPEVDLPATPAATLAPRWERALPSIPQATAPGPDGDLSVWLDDHILHLDAAGDEHASLEIDVPVWPDQKVPMGWLGDTLWVADPSRGEVRRYVGGTGDPQVRGPRGRLADTPPEPVGRGGLAVPIPTTHPDRWLWTRPTQPPFVPYSLPDDPPGPEFVTLTDEWLIHRVMASLWPGVHELAVDTGDEAPVVIGPDPFEDHPLSAVAPDGSSVTVVVRDHPTLVLYQTQHVFRMNLEGDTVFSVERPAPLVRIDGATVDRISEDLGSHPDLRSALPFAGFEAHFVAGSLYRPPFHPPTSDLLVGTDGRTWLRGVDRGSGPVRWEVLDPTGELEAVFELDRQVRLVAADADGAWGLQDPLGDSTRLVRFEMESVP